MIWRSILLGLLLGGMFIATYIAWDMMMVHVEPRIHDRLRNWQRRKSIARLVGSGHYTEEEAAAFFDENWPAR